MKVTVNEVANGASLDFAASDRGIFALIRPRSDPAAAADRTTAESLDACYGRLLAHRDALHFGP